MQFRFFLFCFFFVFFIATVEGNETINPLSYGLEQAKSDIERYQILLKCHEDAIEIGANVNYKGIKKITLEIPSNGRSIPLPQITDFSCVTFYVTNNQKDFSLFSLRRDPVIDVTVSPSTIDNGDYTRIRKFEHGSYMVIVEDKCAWVENRKGYDGGATRRDIIIVKNGKARNMTIMPYDTPQTRPIVSYVPICGKQKVVKNMNFVRDARSTKITNFITIENQYNVLLSNIKIKTPVNEVLFGDKAISVYNSSKLTLDCIDVDQTYSLKKKYGYGIYLNNVYDILINRMKARASWGVFGTNNVQKATLKDCDINRFDIHCYGKDVKCYSCKFTYLYNQFSSVFGHVYFEKCTFTDFIPLLMESSYNAYTPFELIFKSCLFNLTAEKNYLVTLLGLEEAHNSRPELYRKALPNITILNSKVNLNNDVKDWYIVQTGPISYKDSLDYINTVKIIGLNVNSSVRYKTFSKEIKTTEPLKLTKKRVVYNDN